MSMIEVIIWGVFGVIFGAAFDLQTNFMLYFMHKGERRAQIKVNNKCSNATHYFTNIV
jgi:hypothetical protein